LHVTRNFSEKLGRGAFGSVFKGKLQDSTVIAVKRLDGFHQGEKQFRAEVSTIGSLGQPSMLIWFAFLVSVLKDQGGCSCIEFMPKGSLEVQLFRGETTALNWAIRLPNCTWNSKRPKLPA
jgi:hypothetical protein